MAEQILKFHLILINPNLNLNRHVRWVAFILDTEDLYY